MKFKNYCIQQTFLMVLILLLPVISVAAVKEVTLFPNSARISETAKLNSHCPDQEKCRTVLTLPSQADPESFVVSLPPQSRIRIEDVQIKPAQSQDEAKIIGLRRQIAALQNEKKEKQAKLQALDAQMQFWQAQTKARTKTIAESYQLAEAIGKNIRIANQEKYSVEAQLEKIEKDIKKLQDELNQAAGLKDTAWQVTITTYGSSHNESIFSFSYSLAGCGWLPLYRVEALPADQKVAFSWEAEVWQSSGEDWKDVQLNLATLQPTTNVNPPEMPEWIIRPRVLYKSARSQTMAAAPLMQPEENAEDTATSAVPVETKNTTYFVWSLGKKNIAAGDRQRLKIKDQIWPAEFLFMARPSINPQAFVRAQVKLEQTTEIPPGQAIFIIDGAILKKREFSFTGNEGEIFFGTSPLISVISTKIADQTDTKTIFQDKQTRSWQWLIEARNSGNADVKLRIEEPVPQARNKKIRLSFRQNPEPSEKDHTRFVWILDVPAQQKKTIQNIIELEAPADMNIDFGWR